MKVQGVIVGVLFLSPVVWAAGEPIEKWTVWNYWQMLTPKMTEQVVVEILGEPLEKEFIKNYQIWYYQQVPKKEGEKIISRPQSGCLRFRKVDSAYFLYESKSPDWTVTAPHTEAQYLAQQEKIQKQKEQEPPLTSQAEPVEQAQTERQHQLEQAMDERQQLLEQQQIEAQKLAAERREDRDRTAEQAKQQMEQRRQELAERREQQPVNPKPKPPAFELSSYKYWFTMAGLFIIGAILISVMYKFKK